MASLNITGMDELLKKLEKLSNQSEVETIAKKAVTAAQPINESAMRSAIAGVEHGPYATGSVSASISSTETMVNSYGVYAVARPTGRDAKGVRNAEKAAYLQYGSPRQGKRRLSPRPWRQSAVSSAEGACVKAMEEVIRAEMELD